MTEGAQAGGEGQAPSPSNARRRFGDAAVAPLIGLFLLSPPIVGLPSAEIVGFGAPMIVVYVFVVWLALVIWARRFAKRVQDGPEFGPPQADEDR